MLGNEVFELIATKYLKADLRGCTDWFGVDVLLGYARGRACYWFELTDAHGELHDTTISLRCNVKAGGGLELQLCIRVPCAPDQCATYSPGFGLQGPLGVTVTVSDASWADNQALLLTPFVSEFPGFEVYGLPPGVDDVVNAILNFVSSVILKAFFNSILSLIDFYVVENSGSERERRRRRIWDWQRQWTTYINWAYHVFVTGVWSGEVQPNFGTGGAGGVPSC